MASVKIDRLQRKVAHEVFPRMVSGPIRQTATYIDWLIRTQGDGMTPNEKKYLRHKEGELKELAEDLHKIYFRLKH